jgi:chromosome segregation ATPase
LTVVAEGAGAQADEAAARADVLRNDLARAGMELEELRNDADRLRMEGSQAREALGGWEVAYEALKDVADQRAGELAGMREFIAILDQSVDTREHEIEELSGQLQLVRDEALELRVKIDLILTERDACIMSGMRLWDALARKLEVVTQPPEPLDVGEIEEISEIVEAGEDPDDGDEVLEIDLEG